MTAKLTIPTHRVKHDLQTATSYLNRPQRKHDREMLLIDRAITSLKDVNSIIDAPCGVGRASIQLAQRGISVTAIDLGHGAVQTTIEQAKLQGLAIHAEQQNIFNMSFSDQSFDAALCFRLLHHFQDLQVRNMLIKELCRVSSKYVILSYISNHSITTMRRLFRYWKNGTPIKQYPSTLSELSSAFSAEGYVLYKHLGGSPLLNSLQVAIFEKDQYQKRKMNTERNTLLAT